MREIKFRAWDKACDVMLVPEDANKWVMHGNGCSAIDGVWATDDLVLMQYTGLKDKNGVEIYEGDILSDQSFHNDFDLWRGTVTWNYGGYSCISQEGEKTLTYYAPETQCEVIGNIYENKELLE